MKGLYRHLFIGMGICEDPINYGDAFGHRDADWGDY